MNLKRTHEFSILLLTLLVLSTFYACNSFQTYTFKKEGTDVVLDGSVHKAVLNDPKLYPWYYYGYKACKTDTLAMKALKPLAASIKVICFGGSWCGDTQRELPRLMRILDELGVPENHCQIFMLNRQKKSAYLNPEVWGVEHVPTIIFYKNGKECGRFVEEAPAPLEKLMATWYTSGQ